MSYKFSFKLLPRLSNPKVDGGDWGGGGLGAEAPPKAAVVPDPNAFIAIK